MGIDFTVKDLLETLDGMAAFDLAEKWDNVGLMLGDPGQKIQGILVALDPTEEVLSEAIASSANCIITHHPLIFNPLKAIYINEPLGRFLRLALENDISVFSCHTNLDQAAGGVNDALAECLGMVDLKVLAPAEFGQRTSGNSEISDIGFGRVGRLAEPIEGKCFVEQLCALLGLPVLRMAGQMPAEITTIAVCGGSGSELAEAAFASGAQVYITGEVKHSTARWAEAAGFCIIDAGHFATENPVVASLVKGLGEQLVQKGCTVPVRQSEKQQDPFTYMK